MRGFRDEYDNDGDEPHALGHVKCLAETDKAIRVSISENDPPQWIPKSVIHADSEIWSMKSNGGEGVLMVKLWWARKEGIVDE